MTESLTGDSWQIDLLEAALQDEHKAQAKFNSAHLTNMNVMADAITEGSQHVRLEHFLFAMHGISHTGQSPEVEQLYTTLHNTFGVGNVQRVFTLPEDRTHRELRPDTYRMYGWSALELSKETDNLDNFSERSAIKYRIERHRDWSGVRYIGKLLLPSWYIDTTGRATPDEPTLLGVFREKQKAQAEMDEYTFDASEVYFGNDVAKYARKHSLSHYEKAVQGAVEASTVLELAAK